MNHAFRMKLQVLAFDFLRQIGKWRDIEHRSIVKTKQNNLQHLTRVKF
jgi:hypothetical protein